MKIAFIFISMPVGGAEDFAVTVARRLPAGCEPLFVCLRELGRMGKELSGGALPVHLVPVAPGKRWNVAGIWRLAGWLRRNGVAVVHSQTYNAHTYAIPAARLAGAGSVIHQQKTFRRMRPHRMLMMAWLTRLCDRVLALSPQTRDDLARAFRLAAGRVSVVPNVIDGDEFRPVADARGLRVGLGLDPASRQIGAVASLASVKNHPMTLRMLAGLGCRGIAFHASFMGEGPERGALERLVGEMGLGDRVRLLGAVRPVAPWMRAMDLVVQPSSWEGQPLSLLQAMSCGVPVVATRIEGNVAVLGERHPGLFAPDDLEGYIALVARVLEDEGFRAEILAHQAVRLGEWPDAATLARGLAEIYASIARGTAR